MHELCPGGIFGAGYDVQQQRGGKAALSYRENKEYVDGDGNIIKDCEFKSPSTAAQFVTGTSINGMLAWKTKDGKSLKASVAEE